MLSAVPWTDPPISDEEAAQQRGGLEGDSGNTVDVYAMASTLCHFAGASPTGLVPSSIFTPRAASLKLSMLQVKWQPVKHPATADGFRSDLARLKNSSKTDGACPIDCRVVTKLSPSKALTLVRFVVVKPTLVILTSTSNA